MDVSIIIPIRDCQSYSQVCNLSQLCNYVHAHTKYDIDGHSTILSGYRVELKVINLSRLRKERWSVYNGKLNRIASFLSSSISSIFAQLTWFTILQVISRVLKVCAFPFVSFLFLKNWTVSKLSNIEAINTHISAIWKF